MNSNTNSFINWVLMSNIFRIIFSNYWIPCEKNSYDWIPFYKYSLGLRIIISLRITEY